MSKRTASCDHTHWEVLPGNVIRCQHCGEEVATEELARWLDHEEVVEITIPPKPLTYRMKDLNILEGGHNG